MAQRRWPSKEKTSRFNFNVDGIKHLVEGVEELEDLSGEVGVLRDERSQQLAIYHEYGTFYGGFGGKVQHIPARPFIRPTEADAKKDIIPDAKKDLIEFILFGPWSRPSDIKDHGKKILNQIGSKLSFDMKSRILQHIPPPLKKKTVQSKIRQGFPLPETPLIATGKMYQSIDHRVRDKGRFVSKKES